MLQPHTVSTDDQPPRKRIAFWNQAVGSALIQQVADPADPAHFRGSMKHIAFGGVRLAEIHAQASAVTRSATHVAHMREAMCMLRLQLVGDLTARYGHGEVQLHPGDFMLYETSRPYRMWFEEPSTILAICIPRQTLLRYIACPEAVTCRVMSGASGAGALAARFLQDFWRHCSEVRSEELVPRLFDVALRLIASTYADVPDARPAPSCVATGHRLRIVQHIERYLSDPELTPTSIAEALHITPAYLHRVFSTEPESVARYIVRRRLEECAQSLDDPMQATRSVTDIAFQYGFNSLAHFSRAFHARYGVAPRQFRKRKREIPLK